MRRSTNDRDAPSPLLLSPKQACARLNVGTTTLYALIGSHRLAAVKIGRATMIPVAAIDAYVASLPPWKPAAERRADGKAA